VPRSCHELERRSVAVYQMSKGKQPNPGLGSRELKRALVTVIFLAFLVGVAMAIVNWVPD